MARNQKLTKVIKGRRITAVERQGETVRVTFDDGSVMTVRTDGTPPAPASPSGRVVAVRQAGTTLRLDLDDGTTLELHTAEPTASVLLRAKDHTLEYAD